MRVLCHREASRRPHQSSQPPRQRSRSSKTRLQEIDDLSTAGAVLSWDQGTCMPPKGAAARRLQMATLNRLGHERLTDPAIGRLPVLKAMPPNCPVATSTLAPRT